MSWFNVVSLISIISLFLPIIIMLALRLAWYKTFPALLVYYFLVSTYNLFSLDFIKADSRFLHYYGIFNNLLDAPLMLSFMTYFSQTASFRKKMKLVIPIFILFELVVIAIYRFDLNEAMVIAIGPGLLLVLIFSLLFFIHQAKITVIHQKAAGKALISAALLFAYGGYSFIYVVYYLNKTPYKTDAQIVYFLVTTFSSIMLVTGVFFERRRVRQLTELKITREELKVIY